MRTCALPLKSPAYRCPTGSPHIFQNCLCVDGRCAWNQRGQHDPVLRKPSVRLMLATSIVQIHPYACISDSFSRSRAATDPIFRGAVTETRRESGLSGALFWAQSFQWGIGCYRHKGHMFPCNRLQVCRGIQWRCASNRRGQHYPYEQANLDVFHKISRQHNDVSATSLRTRRNRSLDPKTTTDNCQS